MAILRIIGDVHGQVDDENLMTRGAPTYSQLITAVPYSIQIGDMGDGDTYDFLKAHVDLARHRFFPGNHDHYDQLPPHTLGDFGGVNWGGVDLFFVRGAASTDREKLLRVGRDLGRTLWFAEEELTDAQMFHVEQQFLAARPRIMLSHDAPTSIARFAWQHARRLGPPNPGNVFQPSRTNQFLSRLLEQHAPELWLFGHHHRDCQTHEGETLFVCVGELSYYDIYVPPLSMGE